MEHEGTSTLGDRLRHAAQHEHPREVLAIIKEGADVNSPDRIGQTPLHYAVRNNGRNGKAVVTMLIANGAQVDIQDRERGWTPLHLAASMNFPTMAEVLVKNGADPFIQGKDGITPLHAAVAAGADKVTYAIDRARRQCESATMTSANVSSKGRPPAGDDTIRGR